MTEGALVSSGDSQAMATVQQISKVYIDVRQPASQAQQVPLSGASASNLSATLLSASGEPFKNATKILFRGVSVDTGTGDVVMRLEADNSNGALLPGMYLQARISQPLSDRGITVPQQAVVRQGEEVSVWLDDGGKAKSVPVSLGESLKGHYFVRSGLKEGDRLVVQGAGKLSDGMPLQAADEKPHADPSQK